MPKPKRAIRPVEKNISLPEDLVARVDLLLFSEVEGKVPHGAWARFVEERLRHFFTTLDKQYSQESPNA